MTQQELVLMEIYDVMPAERIQKRREGAPKLAWILANFLNDKIMDNNNQALTLR